MGKIWENFGEKKTFNWNKKLSVLNVGWVDQVDGRVLAKVWKKKQDRDRGKLAIRRQSESMELSLTW